MKVEKIIVAFQPKTIQGKPVGKSIIYKVLDSIDDFKRKIDLRPTIKELKEIYEQYREDEVAYIKKLIKEYCDEENEKNKDVKEYKLLDPEKINLVPNVKRKQYHEKIKEMSEVDIKLKKHLVFTLTEIENSKIDFSDMEVIEDFIDFKEKKMKN